VVRRPFAKTSVQFGDTHRRTYREAFVAACVELLTDDAGWERHESHAAVQRAWRDYNWPAIAEHWDVTFRAALSETTASTGQSARAA
jgi:hypothetical protein